MENKPKKTERHKCSICGRVRYAYLMFPIRHSLNSSIVIKTRYGHACWCCSDSADCKAKSMHYRSY